MPAYVKVAKSSEIGPGTAKLVEAGSKKIALLNVEGSLHAIDDTCAHRGGPLSEGMLVGNEVTWPRHGAVFDVTTGDVVGPPAPRSVTSYRVRTEDDDVEVEI